MHARSASCNNFYMFLIRVVQWHQNQSLDDSCLRIFCISGNLKVTEKGSLRDVHFKKNGLFNQIQSVNVDLHYLCMMCKMAYN